MNFPLSSHPLLALAGNESFASSLSIKFSVDKKKKEQVEKREAFYQEQN